MNIVFISPCFNAENNLEKLIESVRSQSDTRWSHILIDDISSDNTHSKLNEICNGDSRFKIISNKEKKFALRNIVEATRNFQDRDDTVIAVIDGDDQLCNDNTVKLLLDEYESGLEVVWTAHRWDINNQNISRDMPDNVDPYSWPWCSSHLRTFKSELIKNISDNNFKDMTGKWFERGYDQALMLPILKQTTKRKYINEICYLYNIDSVSVDDRDWAEMKQISTINMVRARGLLL
jgi:glycosyltransferase involved in cell wall biosynthesis